MIIKSRYEAYFSQSSDLVKCVKKTRLKKKNEDADKEGCEVTSKPGFERSRVMFLVRLAIL